MADPIVEFKTYDPNRHLFVSDKNSFIMAINSDGLPIVVGRLNEGKITALSDADVQLAYSMSKRLIVDRNWIHKNR